MDNNKFSDVLFNIYMRDYMYQPIDYSFHLRFEWIGAELDLKGLHEIGITVNENEKTIEWEIKLFKTRTDHVQIFTDKAGHILYIDLGEMSSDKRAYNKFIKVLNPLMKKAPEDIAENNEKYLCSSICEAINLHKESMQNFIPLYMLLRKFDEIEDNEILADLTYLCGGFALWGEFYHALIKLHNKRVDLSPNSLTNNGTALFNVFHNPLSATMCFERVLEIDPSHPQAQHNLLVGTKSLMIQNIVRTQSFWAIQAGEKVCKLINHIDDSDFFIILGFAYELSGNMERAFENYTKSKELDRDNLWAKEFLYQINDSEFNRTERMRLFESFINESCM